MQKKKVTIKDIAKEAEVSISTVSRVINNKDRVDEKTRAKVQHILDMTEFVPNNLAVSMVKGQTKIVGIVVPDIVNPFYAAVIQGVEQVAKSMECLTVVFANDDNKELEQALLGGVFKSMADGVVAVPAHPDSGQMYADLGKPVVFADRHIAQTFFDTVTIDNFGGAYMATAHLIQNGHTRIAIINGLQTFNVGKERLRGYQKAMEDHGIQVDENLVRFADWTEKCGSDFAEEIVNLKSPPTAIFATNNLLCRGVISAIGKLNIRIGEDISLVGFDDDVLAGYKPVNVTVVDRPTHEVGVACASLLFERLSNPEAQKSKVSKRIVLGTQLIERSSVKKL